MIYTIQNFEAFLLIFVRITGFIFTAPFFSLGNVPIRVKTGIAIFMAAILFYTVPYTSPEYIGIIGFSILVVKEALAGAIMGFFANIAYQVISFAGEMIDMDVGFSMVNLFDPVSNMQTTITSNFYGYLVLLMMLITNLHHKIIQSFYDSFQTIRIGEVNINPASYHLMIEYIIFYFKTGFRIVLPIYAAILIVNTILAILSKIAPQMNMFVIGMQIKIFIGLIVLILVVEWVPGVADFIFNKMIDLLNASKEILH